MTAPRNIPGIVAPLVCGLWFTLECYLGIRPFATFGDVAETFFYTVIAACVVYGVARLTLRRRDKAALFSAWFLLTTYFFSYLQKLSRSIPGLDSQSARRFLVVTVVLWCIAFVALLRSRRDLSRLHRYVLVTTLLFCVYAGARLFGTASAAPPMHPPPAINASGDAPDIYFILADSHTSPESLQRYWKYDAAPFVSALQQRGFHVIPNAAANSDQTILSMPVVLNMDHPSLLPSDWKPYAQRAFLTRAVQHASVKRALSSAGYDIIDLGCFPGFNGEKPEYEASVVIPNVQRVALMKTFFGNLAQNRWYMEQGSATLEITRKVEQLAVSPAVRPRFVYAHLMMPHWPYFFDRTGAAVHSGSWSDLNGTKEQYLEQLIYVDRLLTNMVAKIQQGSRRPPVIVIQADHGFRELPGADKRVETFTILNALYLPGGRTNVVPFTGITPVNTFRLVLNRYFDAGLPYVADKAVPASDFLQGHYSAAASARP